jgi:hypothetical protein
MNCGANRIVFRIFSSFLLFNNKTDDLSEIALFKALHAIWHLIEIIICSRQNEPILDQYSCWLEMNYPRRSFSKISNGFSMQIKLDHHHLLPLSRDR